MKYLWTLLLLLPVSLIAKQPIGFKHWQLNDTTFSKQVGGSVRNYEKVDKTWAVIENDFEAEGDSVIFVNKSVLRARVNKEGVSKVMLTWEGQEYTVTQKMLGIGWIKISTRQSQWIDSTMNWSNFSVDSNICKWTNISPAVDYRVRKSNGSVAHGIFYKPAFLDSAVVLYNQRPDSLDIALANVMIYTLSANIDDYDSAMGDLPMRRLKDFGYYSFNLSDQRLRFPGSDTLPQIPIRQYWERRGTKIICIEYVMMSKIKRVHEAYPSATIWHNITKKIDGTTNVEDCHIYAALPENNYGGAEYLTSQTTSYYDLIRVQNVASELSEGVTITACVCSLYCYTNTVDGNTSVYRVFKPWNEGNLINANPADAAFGEGIATWNDWSNDDEEWTTAGCMSADDGGSDNSGDGTGADRKATAEDTENVTTVNTWYGWNISTTLAQGWYDETMNENGIIFLSAGNNKFRSTEYSSNQPFWTFTYTSTFPVLKNYTSNNNGTVETDSVMLGKPTGVEIGDLLLLIAGNDYVGAASAFDVITGWTRFINIGDGATDCKLACYWRIADGTETDSIEVTTGVETDEIWGWYIRVSNVDQTTPINDVGTALLNASSSSHAITEATSTVDNCLVIYALSFDGGDGYPFSESGTDWLEEDEQQAGDAGGDASGCWGIRALASQGGAGTVTITSSAGDGAAAIQFAIAPSEEAPPAAAGAFIMIQ